MRRLRIAICFGTFPPERNGGSDFVARFSAALNESGSAVHVLTSRHESEPPEESVQGVTVHRVVDDWTLARGRPSLRRLNDLVRREGIDVVHALFPDSVLQAGYQLPAFIGLGRVPLVTTFWNLGLGRRSPVRLRLESLALLTRSRALTSHDPTYLGVLRKVAGPRTVAWIPVGNNVGRAPRAGRSPGPFRLAYFGQLDATRGAEELFEAVRRLRERHDVRLSMIGSGGRPERYDAGELERYRRLPEELGIDALVDWTPYLPDEDVAALLASADLCVLPYRRNSLGRSALAAAFENGIPVVLAGTPAGIAPLRDGEHVALTPPGDAAALAARIAGLIEDPARLRALELGAEDAARFFSWPSIVAEATRVYTKVVG
jgi:glycosyltransferase involved in cell wall biosynthesis